MKLNIFLKIFDTASKRTLVLSLCPRFHADKHRIESVLNPRPLESGPGSFKN